MASCLRRTRAAIAVFKAIISRTLFALHGFICIWRVTVIKGEPLYWCLTGTLLLMMFETVFTIKKKKGGEWKWLCPSVLLYLGTAVPAIWFLEMDLMKSRMLPKSNHNVGPAPPNASRQSDAISSVLNGKLRISISLGKEEWCKILEQMLLLILIIGRWLLPKGEITREQLSQLLLVYIGMAADIIELFEAFKEEGVRENYLLTLIILGLWTASLLQFTLVLTATKSKRMRSALFRTGSTASAIGSGGKSCCPTEVMSIVISMMLQDGPFLVLRLLLIFRYDVLSYTNLFFTSKNTLVLVLQFYRLVVLFSQKKKDESTRAKTLQAEQSLQDGPEAGGGRGGRGGGGRGGRRGGGRGGGGGEEGGGGGRGGEEGGGGRGGGGGPHGSLEDAKDRRVRKTEPSAVVKFTREDDATDDEGVTSDDDDDVTNASEFDAAGKRTGGAAAKTSSSKSPRSARRESFKRQQHAVLDSPPTSTERDYDGNDPTGTPTSPSSSLPHSDAEAAVHAVRRLKAKAKAAGKRKASEDSTRGSMSGDSREDVRGGKGRRGGAEKGFRRQRSAKEKWGEVKSLARAIAFVHDAGKYKTLVLKPVETADHQTVFMVESEQVTGINCV